MSSKNKTVVRVENAKASLKFYGNAGSWPNRDEVIELFSQVMEGAGYVGITRELHSINEELDNLNATLNELREREIVPLGMEHFGGDEILYFKGTGGTGGSSGSPT